MMARLGLILAAGFCLPSCVSTPVPPESEPTLQKVFEGTPTYPVTKIPLPSGLELRQVARKNSYYREKGDESPLRPEIESAYELRDIAGDVTLIVPSMLTDPLLGLEEFREYNLKSDDLMVAVSETGNTILIVEDRSPHYPNRSHVVLQRVPGDVWIWSAVDVPLGPEGEPPTSQYWAKVVGLNDEEVVVSLDGKASTIRIIRDGPSQPSE